jgi:Family of unknown function (DUF6526)
MAERRPQTLKNHVRRDPVFHFFLLPLSALMFVAAVWHAIRHPEFVPIWLAVASFLLMGAIFLIRVYSLKVQNRVIRLEERLRLVALLPESQRARIGDLTEGQLIALRFASDAELSALVNRALAERLTPADIKKSIRSWRADYFRV